MRSTLLALALLSTSTAFANPSTVPIQTQTASLAIAPKNWFLAGNKPQDYRTDMEGDKVAVLASRVAEAEGFGTMMQKIDAGNLAGKRIRFQASVRSEQIKNWAGLWMRVDHGERAVAFDNMESRPITGDNPWKTYDVVLDVPADATSISFGVLVAGVGKVWLSDGTLQPVGLDVPLTTIDRR